MYESLQYITLGGNLYAVQQGTYSRKWVRQFTATLVSNMFELNYVDKGPGIQTYDFTLILQTWPVGSTLYRAGCTQTMAQQIATLETLYMVVATSIPFLDPYGNPPTQQPGGPTIDTYFTDMQEMIPQWSTPNSPCTLMTIELTSAIPPVKA